MPIIAIDKQYYQIPPKLSDSGITQVSKYEFNRQAIKAFFQSPKGSRRYLPGWGFDFFRDMPYALEELKAIVILELATWFPAVPVDSIEVFELDYGQFEIIIDLAYVDTEKITITIQ